MQRVEKKYLCTDYNILLLKQRLSLLLAPDNHQENGQYGVRSVYFDTPERTCYYENQNGVDERKKYRLRIYSGSDEVIKFEIKRKRCGKTDKTVYYIDRSECEMILNGQLCQREEIDFIMREKRLRPVTVIDYERTAYVYPIGNVRITFDQNITASPQCHRFFSADMYKVPILPTHMHIMEVKYDALLPDVLAEILDLGNLKQTTFSKYYMGCQVVGI